ncbi:histone deacetylase family protein [Psychromarinibacter halotolerans]|uniref:Histone deacetylase family protein n=1 Tax=Psychromarinibacter halotolerans TaxID=1775175 RepID=A0ABV7GNG1_9RHOB|nr:histone deacetylase family protein [Psychromarinibacter halotolerans]MDF0595711.1 histone deacetylase family protein [Psychromarinibacter halotolerans]
MVTALFTHASSLDHVTPPGHPERVARYEAVTEALSAARFDALDRRDAPVGDRAEILRCHPEDYIAGIEAAIPAKGLRSLDPDTHVSAGSLEPALRGVGGICAAVDAVLAGEAGNAFVAMRPPGHHAETARSMGFCLFGNAAIGAKRALDHHALTRVAVLDFDVHHGNGTQDLLWAEPRAFFASSHQVPLYPGTGDASETGASGNVMNVPLAPGTGGAEMRRAWGDIILPAVRDFAPELIIISAGFDADAADPLAQLEWNTDDFAWVTQAICTVAAEVCGGRVVSTLEGGYDLQALAAGVAAHVDGLMEFSQ